MLLRLLPEQVSTHWGVIKYAIEESLPPIADGDSDRMNNILTSLLLETSECWVSYGPDEKVDGLVVTQLIEDLCSKTKSLLIYCLYGFLDQSSRGAWTEGLKSLYSYAKSKKCTRIIGYTDVNSIIKFVQRVGGETRYTFISMPVNLP